MDDLNTEKSTMIRDGKKLLILKLSLALIALQFHFTYITHCEEQSFATECIEHPRPWVTMQKIAGQIITGQQSHLMENPMKII